MSEDSPARDLPGKPDPTVAAADRERRRFVAGGDDLNDAGFGRAVDRPPVLHEGLAPAPSPCLAVSLKSLENLAPVGLEDPQGGRPRRPTDVRRRADGGLLVAWREIALKEEAMAAAQSFRPFRTPRSRSLIGAASLWRRAMGDLLQPVGDGPHHNIAAQSWRVGPKESPPFQTQVGEGELSQDHKAIRHLARAVRRAGRSPSPDFGTVRRRPGVILVEAAGDGPPMRLGGRIDRPPRQALRARSHWDHAPAARVATSGRPRRGRFRHAPGGRRSRDGEGRSARRARYGATTPWRRSAHPTWHPDRVGAIRSPARSSRLAGAPSLLAPPLRSRPPPCLLRSSP